ncbi:hypothetical protein ACQY0O_006578 [Thecaphora frezii]
MHDKVRSATGQHLATLSGVHGMTSTSANPTIMMLRATTNPIASTSAKDDPALPLPDLPPTPAAASMPRPAKLHLTTERDTLAELNIANARHRVAMRQEVLEAIKLEADRVAAEPET